MITCNLMGGLGNQLFQIFATISYAINCNDNFVFTNSKKLINSNVRYTYWDNFLSFLSEFTQTIIYDKFYTIKEKDFHYNELPILKNNENVLLSGYFQSYKYFEENKEKIFKIINLEKKREEVLKKYDISEKICKHSISIHFRLGDYIHLQHVHPILSLEYYEKSLKYIINKISNNSEIFEECTPNVLVFCEKEDKPTVENTIQILKNKCQEYNIEFIFVSDEIEDWEQLLLMSCCTHNIIANSTFSWWGAYMNTNTKKIVCYPQKWFNLQKLQNSIMDLCPKEWVSVVCEN